MTFDLEELIDSLGKVAPPLEQIRPNNGAGTIIGKLIFRRIRIPAPVQSGTSCSTPVSLRVLQVGHELRHIDQYRAGMIGHDRQPEREFLAHCWAVFAGERPGTGRMSPGMRVALIDAALGNLNCLSAQVRARYRKHEERLRVMRATEQTASGRAATLPPAACVRSP